MRGRGTQAAGILAFVALAVASIYVAVRDAGLELGPVAWEGDYETGDLSQWEAQSACTGNDLSAADVGNTCISVVREPRREGAFAARFRIGPHTDGVSTSERAEVYATRSETGSFEGREWIYVWSTLFPSDGNDGWWTEGADWNYFSQFHNSEGECGAALGLGVDATPGEPQLYFALQRERQEVCSGNLEVKKLPLGELRFDHWYEFALRVRWSSDPRVGSVELWVDDDRVVERTSWPTMHDDSGAYWKQGFYRGATEATNTVVHDGSRRVAVPG